MMINRPPDPLRHHTLLRRASREPPAVFVSQHNNLSPHSFLTLGVDKCQNISFPLTPATFSTPDKTSNPHTKKKRRISGTSDTVNRKYKSPSGTPSKTAITTHTPTPARGPSSGSSSKCTATPFPKTNASDLKSLKFNKKSQPNKPTSTPAPRPIATPTKSDRPPMRPLELAKKSPQERAAMRKSK